VDGYWNDLGDPRRYLEVQRDLLSASGRNPSVVLSPEARVHASSRVGPFVSAEKGCCLESETSAENAVLWEDVTMKKGSSVHGCIVGSGMTVNGAHMNRIVTRYGEIDIV
ncbi:MAG: hypothetical protein V1792_25855, partial [Pseudomonadota bacterium]